jgi:hypothetical protein
MGGKRFLMVEKRSVPIVPNPAHKKKSFPYRAI